MTWWDSDAHRAMAQTPITAQNKLPGEKTISQVNVLFVNPSVGDDTSGNGNERTPLRTITQALRQAQPDTVIMLQRGTYSAQSGEVFPLILKPGVSIQGDVRGKGRGIVITGGGEYLSRNFGGQNVAIVAAPKTTLTGVTVTNSNPRGYGVWIESGNPLIADNTFTGNTQDGVSVTGNALPLVRGNSFLRNGANGITITGASQAEIRENLFQYTGFGINIAQQAQPLIVSNQIEYNRSGIVVQASSRPILRNNIIQSNREDGLVSLAEAQPDLGNATEPGGNEFRRNGRYDINGAAAKRVIAVYGNNLQSDRIVGRVDINTMSRAIVNNPQPQNPRENAPESPPTREIDWAAPLPPINSAVALNTPKSRQTNQRQLPQKTTREPLAFPTPTSLTPVVSNTPAWQAEIGSQNPPKAQVNYVQINPDNNFNNNSSQVIEFTAPSTTQPNSNYRPRKRGANTLLPVNSASLSQVNNTTAYNSNPNPQGIEQPINGSRFRVMAVVRSQRDQEIVRFIAPEAFPTVWQGQAVMQAGVFSSRYNAENMLQMLNNNGLNATLEQLGN
ncbi:DUF1565 domain-containing protein [Calothrix sp. 336/3]|uniref:DUF1565 domain-containing protein n=1 Tax=Calothrix sp. 336/3 TaxID=1337936 RepID=UPI001439D312|nr:DUF1565 domain-containing protein [Calothrix sp. 336/3]